MNGAEVLIPILVPIALTASVVIMVIYLRRYQHTERIAMIEKGVSSELFNSKKSRSISGTLRASLLLIGAGLGLLIGYFLDSNYYMEEVGYFSMLFIFGGIGLGLAYIIEERKIAKDNGN
jgi:F0F1-type ATP synthase assembly protein I